MKETINYYYNIYPSKIVEINNGCYFYFNDFKYYFVETSKSIEEIEFLVKVTNSLYKRNIFVDTFIINKNKTFYVALNDKTYVLLRVNSLENDKYSLKDLIYFNNLLILKNNNVVPYDVLWGKKIDVFESEMADLNIDYPLIQESFDYYVGLAENAISYYVDIKETENMNDAKVSLGHKRLNKYVLSGLINNSINFTFDYEIRDTALYIETKFFDGTLDLEEVVEFCINIGLPVTFEELGIKKLDEEKLMEAATLACAEGDTAHNMPFEVTPESVYNAMLVADRIGHYYKDYE